jgi:hypothetical protein
MLGLLLCCGPLGACALVLDYEEFGNQPAGGGGAGQGASGSGGATSGSAGAGGALEPCNPGDARSCYEGPAGTQDVGPCIAGTQTCLPSGEGYGTCEGQVLPAIDYCTSPQDDDCNREIVECTGGPLWSGTIHGPGTQRGLRVAAAPDGELVVAGLLAGEASTGVRTLTSAGGSDVFVVRYSADGNPVAAERWGDAADQVVTGVVVDDGGNVILVGHFMGEIDFGDGPLTSAGGFDVFVAKLDPMWKPVWSVRGGDELDQLAAGVGVDASGTVRVAGSFEGTLDLGGGPMTSAGDLDAFVVAFDASGGWLHSSRFGDAARQQASAIAVHADGQAAVTGPFEGSLDLGVKQFSADAIDGFTLVLDATGGPLWARDIPGLYDQRPTAVAMGPSGDVVVALALEGVTALGEQSAGATDVMVVAFSEGGGSFWTQAWGNAAMQEPTAVALDGAGNVIVAGWFEGSFELGGTTLVPIGGTDGFVAKYKPGGEHVWSHSLAGVGTEEATALTTLPNAEVVVCGWFDQSIQLDVQLMSAGVEDAYVIALSQ